MRLCFEAFTDIYVQRLIGGDREIERHFCSYFSEVLFVKLWRTLRSHQSVEDVRQETFLRVFRVLRSQGGLDHPERLGAFVHGVCKNVLAEHYRASSRYSALPEDGFEALEPGPDPEIGLVTKERKRRIREVLDQMPAKDREILQLLFLEEREKEEVCRICRVDRNYLRVLLYRAKSRFRAGMTKVPSLGAAYSV